MIGPAGFMAAPKAGSDGPYCMHCGGTELAYVEQYADSEEWRCKDCGAPVYVAAKQGEVQG